jgi:hypothetical protein
VVFGDTLIEPKLPSFVVGFKTIVWVTLKVRDIKAVRWKTVHFGEQLPGEPNDFFLSLHISRICHGKQGVDAP